MGDEKPNEDEIGEEKHANEDYVHAERSQPPPGTTLPPDVSGTRPAAKKGRGK